MKPSTPNTFLRCFTALAFALCLFPANRSPAAFVYETPGEFFSAGDFNGDGTPDVLVFDKLTGNARVGYSDGNGNLTWSSPLVTGVQNVTGLGVEHFLQSTRDAIAVTALDFNQVNFVDLSQTNTAGTPQTFVPPGIGPHAVAGLRSPLAPPSGNLPFVLVASSLNNTPSERLDLAQYSGTPLLSGEFNESGPFDLANGLDLDTNTPTFGLGIVRGATNDALHIWQFTNAPSVMLVYSNLASGSACTFGAFNGDTFPRFLFYQPGNSNLAIVPLLRTNSVYSFGSELDLSVNEPIGNIFFLANGTNGSALIQFGDGVQALSLSNGVPILSPKYQTGAGAAGNVFTGIVPLANGQFALLDAPPGATSIHAQVLRFNGANFTKLSASSLPSVSTKSSRANVWLFRLEPFVNRAPGFVASLNSPDWADGVSGLPGAVQVSIETDSGVTNGLGNLATNSLGAAPSGAAFGIGNQYNPAISLFSYDAPRVADAISVTIAPSAGPYGSPQAISFTVTPAGSGVRYRAGDSDPWHSYASPFTITNDSTIEFYGTNAAGARSSIQFANYTFGNPTTTGTNTPVVIDPANTNTPPVFSTNQLFLSQNGTVFYGRRSASNVGTIWAIGLDGSGDTYITTGARPRVSADGRWLAFLREGNPFGSQGNVWIRDLQSGTETRVFTNPNYIACYDWETNDATLLMDYSCGIWDLGTNGSLTSFISADCNDDAPVRNYTDRRIAFHNLNSNTNIAGIYIANADGSGRQRIVSTVPGASWPSWSADGTAIVFSDNNNTNLDSGKNLWITDPAGTNLTQISGFSDYTTNGFPHGAIWSPDGSELIAAGTIFNTNGLWLIPLIPGLNECDGPPVLLPTSPGDPIDFAGSIVVAPAPPSQFVTSPTAGLFIRQTPDAVVVYWSTNYAGYTLVSEFSPTAHSWTPINGPYYLANGYFEYWESLDALAPEKFFRLHLTGAMVLSQPPSLDIQTGNNAATISWSTGYSGFTLQSKPDASPSSSWNDLPGPYSTTNGFFQFQDSLNPAQQRLYRLRGP